MLVTVILKIRTQAVYFLSNKSSVIPNVSTKGVVLVFAKGKGK
jgi:hypothetical protein